MKLMFVEARCKKPVFIGKHVLKLPEKIGLVTTVQFIGQVKEVKSQLEKEGKKVFFGKGKHTAYQGQVLGCDVDTAVSVEKNVDAFLYIGSGLFHPIAISLKTKKDVFTFNPLTEKFGMVDRKEAEKINKKRKGALIKFLSSKEIGVVVTTKPGQEQLKKALELKNKFKDKNFYFLIFNTIDFNQLENFPFIECFVNTVCPRIALDDSIKLTKPIINLEDIALY
ncbi:MAG: diphthamide synthesis protein [Nanoarchaeota archaeon]|nr:diphthamide synthesis protein [Nanoarchaeota archaeon]